MEQFFIQIVTRSLLAIPFICAIIVLRSALKRFPRGYIYALWMLLLVELVFPIQMASPIGFLPNLRVSEQSVTQAVLHPDESGNTKSGGSGQQSSSYFAVGWEEPGQEDIINNAAVTDKSAAITRTADALGAETEGSINVGINKDSGYVETVSGEFLKAGLSGNYFRLSKRGISLFSAAWLCGMIFLLGKHIWQLHKLKKRVAFAVKGEAVNIMGSRSACVKNIWETDGIESPFILPGFRTKIYLPFHLGQKEKEDILAHEHYHIRYLHPWIKWIASLILMIHWFNPFVWIAVKLLAQDMEIICDGAVLRNRTADDRRQYAQTLLKYSMRSSGLQVCLAFGESGTESRIRYLMNVKKPGRMIGLLLLIMIPLCFMGFMPAGNQEDAAVSGGDGGDRVPSADYVEGTLIQEVSAPSQQDTLPAEHRENKNDQNIVFPDQMENKDDLIIGSGSGDLKAPEGLEEYQEPVLSCYIPDFYVENGYTVLENMPEDKYEELARQALRELYLMTGTKIQECCYYYTDSGGFVFGLTESDLEQGRDFYSRYFDESTNGQFWGIASIYIAYADSVWYSPVQQLFRAEDYAAMSDAEKAVWFLKLCGLYNGREAVSCYQPYEMMNDTWRIVMEDGTAYEITLDLERGLATNITGPYPDENINH